VSRRSGPLVTSSAACFVALFAAIASAQRPSSVHTVRIDAIPVDSRGTVVASLSPADFDVREGGAAVSIDEARFVRDTPRALAIYLDEYHITAGAGADRARAALLDLLEREVGPRDVVIVMKPLDSLLTIQPAADREAARRIVATLEGRKGDHTPRTDYERSYMLGSSERIESARTQVGISALNALAVRLGAINDLRKTMLVVTEGLDTVPRRRGQEYLATIDSVIRSANRGHVSIYPIDPRSQPQDSDAAIDEVLGSLAQRTDGRVIVPRGAEELGPGLRAALADTSSYYMLSYRNSPEEDGAFRPVEVRVRRAGVQVRARSGYWAPSVNDRLGEELMALANRPPAPRKVEPMRYSSPLIRPWFGLSVSDEGRMRVAFVWEPSPGVPGARNSVAAARIELTVLDDDDGVVFQGPVLPTGPVVTAQAEPARAVFETEPGRLRLRMKIQDATGRDVDSDVRDLDIRDVRGRVSIGTPEFLRARNALELRTLHENPQAVPVSSREFSRTEQLLIRFPAYAPGAAPVSASARLLNFAGQQMRTLDVRRTPQGGFAVDVALAGLASGEYLLEIAVMSDAGRASERIPFRVTP
jgi:VWFA-related protein